MSDKALTAILFVLAAACPPLAAVFLFIISLCGR